MGAAEIAWDPQQRAGIRLQSGPGCQTYRDLHNDSEGHAAQQLQPFNQGYTRKRWWHMLSNTQTGTIAPGREEVQTWGSPEVWLPSG